MKEHSSRLWHIIMTTLIEKALAFATTAHKGQTRKYTHEPYVEHCKEVQMLVKATGGDEAMQVAALLHDTIEDTEAEPGQIEVEFGKDVLELVLSLTDVSKPEDGNRKARKAKDLAHLTEASARAKAVKLADGISNARSIISHDLAFCRSYLPEMDEMLGVLGGVNEELYVLAHNLILNGKERLRLEEQAKALLKKGH